VIDHPSARAPARAAVVIALNPDHVPIAAPRSLSSNVALMIARLPGRETPRQHLEARGRDQDARRVRRRRGPRLREERDSRARTLACVRIGRPSNRHENQRAEEKRVRFDHPLHVGDRGVEIALECGSATLTTVASMNVMLDARIVATSVQRFADVTTPPRRNSRADCCAAGSFDSANHPVAIMPQKKRTPHQRRPEAIERGRRRPTVR
jgi:hypothetical protein